MDKSRNLQNITIDLSKITTYESGVVQSTAYRVLSKHVTEILKKHDVTMMQWFVLGTIYSSGTGGIRLTDLAKKVDTGLPFLTNLINLLERKNMVHRVSNLEDSRSKFVVVTPDFSRKCRTIEADLRDGMRKSLYKNITPEDLKTYIKVLYQIAAMKS
ncbi:MAG: Transcriptional regulator, MarR family [Candidatus Saccharibacteria bacterium]|nr:Transcriptional regulator, MarR family [Candidatus Saccharibacteria bacterium]